MVSLILFALLLFAVGFLAGYATRALVSRYRRQRARLDRL
jgi:hypothetical protein